MVNHINGGGKWLVKKDPLPGPTSYIERAFGPAAEQTYPQPPTYPVSVLF
jgi:hypothetical protein